MAVAAIGRILLPGLVFQSVLIGGGYATGRELVEFFLVLGLRAGLLGMMVSMVLWSAVLAVSFEFARVTASYDYREFFRALLGRGWVLFEFVYVALVVLVLSVLGSASGELAASAFGLPTLAGTVGLTAAIGVLVYFGSATIARFLAAWSAVLYMSFVALFVLWCQRYGSDVLGAFEAPALDAAWLANGIRYAGYNFVAVIAVLFCLRNLRNRREALLAGLLAGPIAIFPGVLFLVAMSAAGPALMDAAVPLERMLVMLEQPLLSHVLHIVLIGTFIETGVGLVHAVNERIADSVSESKRHLARWVRPLTALGLLGFSILLADRLGIIALVAQGYGTLTWAILGIYVIPVMTFGFVRILRAGGLAGR